jgi:hypothetical protein
MSRILKTALAVAMTMALAGLAGCAQNGPKPEGKWMSGDFHQHTLYTDGSDTFDQVTARNVEFGLDWWANSEHGGSGKRDGNGTLWVKRPEVAILGWAAGNPRQMWRWQSLRDFVHPDVLAARAMYPGKRIVSGLEWNVPGHEHCSTAIITGDPGAISAFEYQSDAVDIDFSREGESTPYGILRKRNGRTGYAQGPTGIATSAKTFSEQHADAVAGCAWLQEQYDKGRIEEAWAVWAHPERQGQWHPDTPRGYNIEHFRDFHNAAPDICFGFEGVPGHQAATDRGGFGDRAFGGTYGGAGYYTATVGGLWDALLGEGRRFFTFASSDYHRHHTAGGSGFSPGEYHKTWVYVLDLDSDGDYSLAEIAKALRSGNSFHAMGDLINSLEFSASYAGDKAAMGQKLVISPGKKGPMKIGIEFSSPAFNANGDTPVVRHVALIAGRITGRIDQADPNYANPTNPTARVIAAFSPADWKKGEDGRNVIVHTIDDLEADTYFRLRFTNQAPDTPGETDAHGNPLADSLATALLGLDGAQEAWADLWAYSNPIFVYRKQP